MPEALKLLIVDDSRLFRSAMEAALSDVRDIRIVGSTFSGEKALEFIAASPPDVLTLDVEMPGIGGLETLRRIQEFNSSRPGQLPVGTIMVSSYTRRGAGVTLEALQLGAFDFIAKPAGASPEQSISLLRDELISKLRAFAASKRVRPPATPAALSPAEVAAPAAPAVPRREARPRSPRAIVIGTSTGGPKALMELLPELCRVTELPILIVQHMPAGFTQSLAESIGRQTSRVCSEVSEAVSVQPGRLYVAPGGKHLVLRGSATSVTAAVNEQPPENGCRPSADVLFRSAAAVYGGELIALILTGMGRDGTAGLGAIRRAGGLVIAQDEASSVVWGMPGSAVEARVVDEVVPLGRIAASVAAALRGAAAV
jgi:two-component system chemotaxis response regulator CheB